MRIGFLDASSGVSGDMLLAAAVAAGADLDPINRALPRLGLEGRIEAEAVSRSGVQAVRLWLCRGKEDKELLGAAPPVAEGAHPHLPGAAGHGHTRTLEEILHRLGHAGLPATAAARARAVFQTLAEAEARAHGHPLNGKEAQPLGAVHFHEVGQDDALMDVVGAAMALEQLGVERLQCSPLNTGSGFVTCAHGRFAVPAPATLHLLRGIPVYSDGTEAELVTPTGAALVRTLAQGFGPMPPLRPEAFGYGAGSYELPGRPDLLRLVVGRAVETAPGPTPAASADDRQITVLEANVDDMNPQLYGYLAERALALGALDIFSCPAQMKKNRPGLLITILAPPAEAARLTALLLDETTTLGVREHRAQRTVLARAVVPVETCFGVIRVKTAGAAGAPGGGNAAPEYEDCREAALRAGVPLKQVRQEALRVYLNAQAERAGAQAERTGE